MRNEINDLKMKLESTTCFIERSEIQGLIEDLEVRSGERLPPKPVDTEFECFGCGS